jgi:hypothetical protein
MSYFEPFFLARNRTLRGCTQPLSLRRFAGWTHVDSSMDRIADALDAQRGPKGVTSAQQPLNPSLV